VQAITGKPYKPTTQGKNERLHQTLFRYLDKQPLAESLAELQTQVDAFDHIYNTQRPHQGLPGRVTPITAWGRRPRLTHPARTPNGPSTRSESRADTSPRGYSRPRICPPTPVSER
jgi:hypothetical protein